MPKTKEQKKEIINDLSQKITRLKSAVLIDFTGCAAKDIFELRAQLKKADCLLQVVKKKLLEKVLQNYQKNQWLEKIQDIKGPMALVLGFGEEIAPSKIIYDFAQKNEKLKILGGILTDSFLEKELVMELAKLPSKPELIARLLSSMQAPISNFVYVLNGNIKGLVTILSKIKS